MFDSHYSGQELQFPYDGKDYTPYRSRIALQLLDKKIDIPEGKIKIINNTTIVKPTANDNNSEIIGINNFVTISKGDRVMKSRYNDKKTWYHGFVSNKNTTNT